MTNDTAARLLDAAQDLVQERGFNAFSYKDLAQAVGIRTASIHYHFQAKRDLGAALMERYRKQLDLALEQIERASEASRDRLSSFIDLYGQTESSERICMCGSFAADRESLSDELNASVEDYISRSETWVKSQLQRGVEAGEFWIPGNLADLATSLVSGLQGGLILARAREGASVVDRVRRTFFHSLGPV